MLHRLILLAVLILFAAAELAPSAAQAQFFGRQSQAQQQDAGQQQQQPKKRRTLMDFLFGNDDQEQAPPPVQKTVKPKPKKVVAPPPEVPKVEKSPTATRLAVFGDSLASDLAAALTRFYAEDPNIAIIDRGVGSSGFVRIDAYDWDKTAADEVAKNTFDIAVMIVGTNDRQTMKTDAGSLKVLTPEWSDVYRQRVAAFVNAVHAANKPLLWVGLPAMLKSDYSAAMGQVSGIQRLAAFAGGADFIDVYDKFVDENGQYSSYGPDLNGNRVRIRKEDGIHFTAAGADKLAFYLSQTIKLYYHGGGAVGIQVADALAGTDAALMVRPPYQGLGQTRLLEIAGAVIPLSQTPKRASDLVTAAAAPQPTEDDSFDLTALIEAPKGRVDDFGVGRDAEVPDENAPAAAAPPPARWVPASVTPVAAR